MRLEPFSAWPAPWDQEVQKVLLLAEQFGIPKLRVKVKFGTLRIQEGDERLLAAIQAADRATQTICPVCGGARERQQGVNLQVCGACEAEGGAGDRIAWIDEIHSDQPRPKARNLSDIDTFAFPTYFTAVSHYAATGEGVTLAVLMAYAQNAESLRQQVTDHIEHYFASHAEYYPSLVVPNEIEELVPAKVKTFAAAPNLIAGNFIYYFKYHLNRS